jgi:DNA invertase Pin-like site-specific DNA recombinase
MKAALYARVSKQNGHQDPEVQLRELREHCQRKGWEVFHEYVDHGVSGSKESRPQLNQLMTDAAGKSFDVVIVWKFDRFARSAQHLLKALESFNSNGVAFVSLTEGIDTSTAVGKLVFTVLGAVAEMERSLIIERVKAGLRKAKATGTRSGRAIGSPRSEANTDEIKARSVAGESVSQIAKSLSISRALVYKRLKESADNDPMKQGF